MKNSLPNILSISIIVIMGVAAVLPVIVILLSLFSDASYKLAAAAADTSPVEIVLSPESDLLLNPSDSITFDDGITYPMVYTSGMVMVPSTRLSQTNDSVSLICYIANFGLFIWLAIDFIKFIININKGKFFIRKNLRYLRVMATIFMIMTVLTVIAGVLNEISIDNLHLKLNGIDISANWELPWSYFVFGLISLLLAQVWSRGIQLKEDQELTI